MATKDYTESELKTLVLNQINNIKGLSANFTSTDADEAYDEAVRECGFEIPPTDDNDKLFKYQWLIQRQRRWYLSRLYEQYILRFDVGELKARQIAKNLSQVIQSLDEQFGAAKSDPNNAHVFYNAENIFGSDIVISSGLIDDRIGQDITEYK